MSLLHLSLNPPHLKTFAREQLPLSCLCPFKGTRTCSLQELEGNFLHALQLEQAPRAPEEASHEVPEELPEELQEEVPAKVRREMPKEVVEEGFGVSEAMPEEEVLEEAPRELEESPAVLEDGSCISKEFQEQALEEEAVEGGFRVPEKMLDEEMLEGGQRELEESPAVLETSSCMAKAFQEQAAAGEAANESLGVSEEVHEEELPAVDGWRLAVLEEDSCMSNECQGQGPEVVEETPEEATQVPCEAPVLPKKEWEGDVKVPAEASYKLPEDVLGVPGRVPEVSVCQDTHRATHLHEEEAVNERLLERHSKLVSELSDLRSCPPQERRQRLRALQLELHPDKQEASLQTRIRPLFCLVQDAWKQWETHFDSTPQKRKVAEGNCTGSPSTNKKSKSAWADAGDDEYKVDAKLTMIFFRGAKAQVIKGTARTPQGLVIVSNRTGTQIQTYGLKNNLRFSAADVQRCYTKDIKEGSATIIVEMVRPGSAWTFWLEILKADPHHLQNLVGACAGAALVHGA